ncbi:MAG: hypothetical protein WD042_11745 [Phycisphaeraceae bacterium]
MTRWCEMWMPLLVTLVLGTVPARGDDAADAAAPAEAAEAPAATQAAPDPAAVALLQRIEAKADDIKSLQATLRYDRIQGLVGDEQRRLGKLYYLAGPPARFAAQFDWLVYDRRRVPQDRSYIFDGVWLVEKIADEKPKKFIKRQVVPPDADPAKVNPLALGAGPFAIPVNMKKDRVLERFQATIAQPHEKDPANSVHLHLVPRRPLRSGVTEVDLWYDQDSLLPLRVRTFEEESENESIITLGEHKVNEEIDAKMIDTSEPKGDGWDVQVTPWEDEKKPQ